MAFYIAFEPKPFTNMSIYNDWNHKDNEQRYDIYRSKEMLDSFAKALEAYYGMVSKTIGNRKKYVPLKFSYNGKDFELTIDRRLPAKSIYKDVINTIIDWFFNWGIGRKFFYNLEYTKDNEYNMDLNEISDFIFINDHIKVLSVEDSRKSRREEIVNCFAPIILEAQKQAKHEKEIEPDFTNYLVEQKSTFGNKELIKEYIRLLKQFKDDIKLDKYASINFDYYMGTYIYTSSVKLDGKDFEEALLEKMESIVEKQYDIIGFIPQIEGWKSSKFFDTNLLSFMPIYNDNSLKVRKHLINKRDEAICNYYEEKRSGGYCGD